MNVIKRNGTLQKFDESKLENVINKAFEAVGKKLTADMLNDIIDELYFGDENGIMRESISVEELQDQVEQALFETSNFDVAKAFILYRDKHKELRFLKERSDYIDECAMSNDNTATLSEVDENANVQNKNVATIESEVYKSLNKQIQRYKMKKQLKKMFPEVADQYEKDLDSHIIYVHDEASSPIPKPYCVAVSMYPFLLNGTSTLDGLKSETPKNLTSFCGQFNNLVFLLSSQFKGAIAFGEFFNVFYYYCVKEWGKEFWKKEDHKYTEKKTISEYIEQCFQNIVYSLNQPAGNRSYQSPFTNFSYYDSGYWHALFDNFVFPDGSKPEWEGVSYLQKKFMKWFNKEREKTLLTFPVETMSLLSNREDIIDKEYKGFTAEMYKEGHSFFTYVSDSPDALASCCRLRNEISKNEFSFTSGLTGVATGSVNVITLNINRIFQNISKEYDEGYAKHKTEALFTTYVEFRLTEVLERVYKYHIAYRALLQDLYEHNMFPVYKAGYISLKQQFSTIGVNGVNEAAMSIGMECNDNPCYKAFVKFITSTIEKENKKHSNKNVRFNLEFVPRLCGHVKPLLIGSKLPCGQRGASKGIYLSCAA